MKTTINFIKSFFRNKSFVLDTTNTNVYSKLIEIYSHKVSNDTLELDVQNNISSYYQV